MRKTTMAVAKCLLFCGGLAALGACGGEEGTSSDGKSSKVDLEPGRSVSSCAACEPAEYCLILTMGDEEALHCVEPSCGLGCDCVIGDGQRRHEECASIYSCQEGSGLLYCGN